MIQGLFGRRTLHHRRFLGGLAAMLVALPATIAFGVTIYSAIGLQPRCAWRAGRHHRRHRHRPDRLGAGRHRPPDQRPCAPAAAVSAFAIELVRDGMPAGNIVVLMLLMLGIRRAFQVLFGFVGIGRLIKYIPYPVVSGYLTGVGLIIIGSQISKLVGAEGGNAWHRVLVRPAVGLAGVGAIGGATIAAMLIGPTLTKRVPGTILGIAAGLATYFALAMQDPAMLQVADNPLIIGELGATGDGYFARSPAAGTRLATCGWRRSHRCSAAPLTLAVLLSVDTLKTCVVLDQMTRSPPRPQPRTDRPGHRQRRLVFGRRHSRRRHHGRDAGQSPVAPKPCLRPDRGHLALVFAAHPERLHRLIPVPALAGILSSSSACA